MRNPVFADPKNDYIFLRIFGSEDRKPLLIGFLNDVLALDGPHRVEAVTLLPPATRPEVPGLRYGIFRARCTDGRGATYAIEVQVLQIEELHRHHIDDVAGSFTEPLSPVEARPGNDDELAITVSEFELWPRTGGAHVPMLSR